MRTALITGASRGIGRAIANKLKLEGYVVLTPDRKELDLSDLEMVKFFLDKNVNLDIDVLINNAGENKVSEIEKISIDDWMRIQNININSIFLLTQHFIKTMINKKNGHILNISSCYSFLSRSGRSAYSTSKGALNSFTRSCALEFGASNILVNSLSPGFVDTELTQKNNSPEAINILKSQIALNRLANPEEISELAFFLVSSKNTYITGQNIVIDGGFSIQ